MRDEVRKRLDSPQPMLNRLSKHTCAEDKRRYEQMSEDRPFFFRKQEDNRTEKSKEFEKRWLG